MAGAASRLLWLLAMLAAAGAVQQNLPDQSLCLNKTAAAAAEGPDTVVCTLLKPDSQAANHPRLHRLLFSCASTVESADTVGRILVSGRTNTPFDRTLTFCFFVFSAGRNRVSLSIYNWWWQRRPVELENSVRMLVGISEHLELAGQSIEELPATIFANGTWRRQQLKTLVLQDTALESVNLSTLQPFVNDSELAFVDNSRLQSISGNLASWHGLIGFHLLYNPRLDHCSAVQLLPRTIRTLTLITDRYSIASNRSREYCALCAIPKDVSVHLLLPSSAKVAPFIPWASEDTSTKWLKLIRRLRVPGFDGGKQFLTSGRPDCQMYCPRCKPNYYVFVPNNGFFEWCMGPLRRVEEKENATNVICAIPHYRRARSRGVLPFVCNRTARGAFQRLVQLNAVRRASETCFTVMYRFDDVMPLFLSSIGVKHRLDRSVRELVGRERALHIFGNAITDLPREIFEVSPERTRRLKWLYIQRTLIASLDFSVLEPLNLTAVVIAENFNLVRLHNSRNASLLSLKRLHFIHNGNLLTCSNMRSLPPNVEDLILIPTNRGLSSTSQRCALCSLPRGLSRLVVPFTHKSLPFQPYALWARGDDIRKMYPEVFESGLRNRFTGRVFHRLAGPANRLECERYCCSCFRPESCLNVPFLDECERRQEKVREAENKTNVICAIKKPGSLRERRHSSAFECSTNVSGAVEKILQSERRENWDFVERNQICFMVFPAGERLSVKFGLPEPWTVYVFRSAELLTTITEHLEFRGRSLVQPMLRQLFERTQADRKQDAVSPKIKSLVMGETHASAEILMTLRQLSIDAIFVRSYLHLDRFPCLRTLRRGKVKLKGVHVFQSPQLFDRRFLKCLPALPEVTLVPLYHPCALCSLPASVRRVQLPGNMREVPFHPQAKPLGRVTSHRNPEVLRHLQKFDAHAFLLNEKPVGCAAACPRWIHEEQSAFEGALTKVNGISDKTYYVVLHKNSSWWFDFGLFTVSEKNEELILVDNDNLRSLWDSRGEHPRSPAAVHLLYNPGIGSCKDMRALPSAVREVTVIPLYDRCTLCYLPAGVQRVLLPTDTKEVPFHPMARPLDNGYWKDKNEVVQHMLLALNPRIFAVNASTTAGCESACPSCRKVTSRIETKPENSQFQSDCLSLSAAANAQLNANKVICATVKPRSVNKLTPQPFVCGSTLADAREKLTAVLGHAPGQQDFCFRVYSAGKNRLQFWTDLEPGHLVRLHKSVSLLVGISSHLELQGDSIHELDPGVFAGGSSQRRPLLSLVFDNTLQGSRPFNLSHLRNLNVFKLSIVSCDSFLMKMSTPATVPSLRELQLVDTEDDDLGAVVRSLPTGLAKLTLLPRGKRFLSGADACIICSLPPSVQLLQLPPDSDRVPFNPRARQVVTAFNVRRVPGTVFRYKQIDSPTKLFYLNSTDAAGCRKMCSSSTESRAVNY